MTFNELLASLGLITDEQLEILQAAAADDLTDVPAETLQDAADILHSVADAVLDIDATEQTDQHIEVLEGVVAALEVIGTETDSRTEQVETRAARAAELAAMLSTDEDETETEDETSEDEPETEPVAEDDTDDDDEGGEPDTPVDVDTPDGEGAEREREPVTAASTPRVGRVAARRPTQFMPPPRTEMSLSDDIASWGLVASANAPGVQAGEHITTEDALVAAFIAAFDTSQNYQGPAARVRLFSMGTGPNGYPEDRRLGRDEVRNEVRIRAAQTGRALTAAGGNTAPPMNRYDIPVVGEEGRPVRDQFLSRFGAERGGVVTLDVPRLADVTGATSVHTNDNDIASASKAFARVEAGTSTTTLVDAVVKRLRFGEFSARFQPELIAAWVKLAAVAHARLAEQTLIASIAAAGRNVSAGDDLLSATRDMLAQLDRLCIAVRSRERLGMDFPFDVLLPDWVYGLVRTDIARQAPGGGTINDETLAVADAAIARFLQTRNINPVWSPDMQVFGEQGVGAIQGFPDTVVGHVAPSGGHLFLDGGQLDLGLVRDSTLNDVNDMEMFFESFEAHHYHHQVPCYQITMDVDPSGTTSAAAAFDPSVTGS